MMIKKAAFAFTLLCLGFVSLPSQAESLPDVTVYKSPYCGCCTAWSTHLRESGFRVKEIKHDDMDSIKRMLGVPQPLESCHTAMVDGYVIEGHVPASDIKRLLAERPKSRGLSTPGMPIGSPGMEQGDHKEPYAVIQFGQGEMTVFSRH